ncbi:twin transmembrane helix small protein [Skermanella mucosa]|uniref:Twin transmembrane helix small protein n=1 Tax=Skermanella cutis TaxID=2775420 RepID=A0ABX7BB55_9PROT|nr:MULTISPECIES: twin transmembrane helix small protein [Skermanella]QQP91629.1 twin transmembrane helix small protein [Skermanella sp. TT6]UEM18713.1 twin transmembrane helix small protein [Skermanella mucosa]
MSGILTFLLVVAMLAVLGALFVGLFAMVRGGEFNDKYGNRMMRLRVILQGVALVLFVLAVIASSA